jgi:prefoldin alpha subunit
MKEEEIQQAVMELEMCRSQLDNLRRQDEMVRFSLEEYMRARDTLHGLKGKKAGDEILVPIGANYFIHGKIGDVKKVLSNLGSSIAAEEGIENSIARLDNHIKDLNEAGQKIAKKVSELEAHSANLTEQLQEEYSKLEKKGKQ